MNHLNFRDIGEYVAIERLGRFQQRLDSVLGFHYEVRWFRPPTGSILLYHARHKDYVCLETLIPLLLEAGFEPVTVSELFGFPPPETSEELYVYDIHKIIGK